MFSQFLASNIVMSVIFVKFSFMCNLYQYIYVTYVSCSAWVLWGWTKKVAWAGYKYAWPSIINLYEYALHVNVLLQKDDSGQNLLDQVCLKLDLAERDYFGLRYIDAEKQRVSIYWPCITFGYACVVIHVISSVKL